MLWVFAGITFSGLTIIIKERPHLGGALAGMGIVYALAGFFYWVSSAYGHNAALAVGFGLLILFMYLVVFGGWILEVRQSRARAKLRLHLVSPLPLDHSKRFVPVRQQHPALRQQ